MQMICVFIVLIDLCMYVVVFISWLFCCIDIIWLNWFRKTNLFILYSFLQNIQLNNYEIMKLLKNSLFLLMMLCSISFCFCRDISSTEFVQNFLTDLIHVWSSSFDFLFLFLYWFYVLEFLNYSSRSASWLLVRWLALAARQCIDWHRPSVSCKLSNA